LEQWLRLHRKGKMPASETHSLKRITEEYSLAQKGEGVGDADPV
jgi:hypothetical protein